MKIRTLLIAAMAVPFSVFSQASLEVTVKNINESRGNIKVGLFTNEDDFLKNVSEGKIVKAASNEITVVFENLKPGDYAISVFHDANENEELDSNWMGIPKEGFAFGNNAMGNFGPPSFDKAKVMLKAGSEKQVLNLKYY